MSYGQSKLYVVLKEEKNGQMQGGVSRIPIELSSSAMRARINQEMVSSMFPVSRVGRPMPKEGGLDRIRYTGNRFIYPNP